MGIKQHFVPLARIGHQPECPAGAQLQVRYLDAPVEAANHNAFFTPVKLKGFAQLKLQRHKSMRLLARIGTPVANERSHLTVAAHVAIGLDLREQVLGRALVVFGAVGVRFEGLFQCGVKQAELAVCLCPAVFWRCCFLFRPKPFAYRVAR